MPRNQPSTKFTIVTTYKYYIWMNIHIYTYILHIMGTVLLLKIRHLQIFGTLRIKRLILTLIYSKGNPNNYNIVSLNIVDFRHLVHVTRETYKMEEVISVDARTPKRRRFNDYFAILPSNI